MASGYWSLGTMYMDGFLNIHKDAGWTSHDVVAKVRVLLKITKVGHAGTLDPQATGVLPICLGKATKVAEFLLHTDKQYRVVMKLGVVTDTQDAHGRVLSHAETRDMDPTSVQKVLKSFIGRIQQIPPMYSAVKVKGQPLYRLARKGQVIPRQPRDVIIHALDILKIQDDEVTFDVVCSHGTYIRTLCADVGGRLGVGAHCLRLERHRSGPFRIEESVTLERLQTAIVQGQHQKMVYGLVKVLGHLPELVVFSESVERVLHGVPLEYPDVQWPKVIFKKGDLFRVAAPERGLIALAKALITSSDLQANRTRGPLFKIEKVLVEKIKNRDYITV